MPIESTRDKQIRLLRMRLLEFSAFELEAARNQFKRRLNSLAVAEALYEELLEIYLTDQLRRAEAGCEEAGNEEYKGD